MMSSLDSFSSSTIFFRRRKSRASKGSAVRAANDRLRLRPRFLISPSMDCLAIRLTKMAESRPKTRTTAVIPKIILLRNDSLVKNRMMPSPFEAPKGKPQQASAMILWPSAGFHDIWRVAAPR